MNFALRFLAATAAVALVPACAGAPDSIAEDDDGASAGTQADALTGPAHYLVERDARRCAAPMCGGFWVQRANLAKTTCADGTRADRCYVADLDLAPAKLGDELASEVRLAFGVLRPGVAGYGRLATTEAFRLLAETRGGAGATYRAKQLGIRCFAAPCPDVRVTKLNAGTARNVAGVDLTQLALEPEAENSAQTELLEGRLHVTGELVAVTGPAGTARKLVATRAFARIAPRTEERAEGAACGGFGGFACAADLVCDVDIANACGGADLSGKCKRVPAACTMNWDPVCGCDGQTYGNDCARLAAGAQLDHAGECAR